MDFHLTIGSQLRRFWSKVSSPRLTELRVLLPLLAIAAGATLLFYVASQYWVMYSEQRHLAREWEQQQQRPAQQVKVTNDGLTRLFIPKINLSAVVVEGTNHKSLLLGPGHIKGTPAPGETGNSVVTGHRDTFFRHIYELSKGDLVTVQRNGRSFNYEVTGKQVVQPTDVSVLDPSSDARLTLITCYPTYFIGPAPERLVVFTRRADDKEAKVEPAGSSLRRAGSAAAH
jgi:LPXTG-site transpeptidase (sortase) family protein